MAISISLLKVLAFCSILGKKVLSCYHFSFMTFYPMLKIYLSGHKASNHTFLKSFFFQGSVLYADS